MTKLLSIIILGMLWCLPISAYEIGNNVYLNACGADPQEYYDKPLNIQNIVTEVPNRIIKLEKSKYDREFQTLATSTTNLGNDKINISVSNFRDLTIKNSSGDVLTTRKISGATSIYEIKHKGKVIAWGVGWHKNCGDGYKHVDFTAFRLFVPFIDSGKVKIQNKLVELKINQVKDALLDKDKLILANGDTISGNSSANTYFYHGASFFEVDNENGINFDLKFDELNKKIDINKLNPALILSILAKYKQVDKLNNYTQNNFDKIYEDFSNNYWWNVWDGFIFIKIDNENKTINNFYETLKKLSITNEKIEKLYEAEIYYALPKEEIEIVKKNCLSNDSYKDIFELIGNCYPWHSSWMIRSIGGEPKY